MTAWPDGGQLPQPNQYDFLGTESFGFQGEPYDSLSQPQQQVLTPAAWGLEAFFLSNGAWCPPEPCTYCRKMRLQCFMLQTTEANPNPVTSCSSCVALFRQCSLAEREKRHPSEFETSNPVIGQLHGVSEEGGLVPSQLASASVSASFPDSEAPKETVSSDGGKLPGKRMSARMVKRTRSLRTWFSRHQTHPYPTDEEKLVLASESGLSKTQVTNWFTNARRRQRQSTRATAAQDFFAQGSPMPQRSPYDLSPLERWRNSPPEAEAVCPAALKEALDELESGPANLNILPASSMNDLSSGSVSQTSSYNPNYAWMDGSSNSASSVYSHQSTGRIGIFPAPERSMSADSASGISANASPAAPAPAPEASATGGSLQCTFCRRNFKKKSDWVRHERTIHVPDLDAWICSLPAAEDRCHLTWRFDRDSPECAYCGHDPPTAEHLRSHEFEACAERPLRERSFARKDHLWQHLQKFHGCRKWEGWSLDLGSLLVSNDNVRSKCGFCGLVMSSWKLRAQHIAAHFRSGLTMSHWRGDAGLEQPESLIRS